MRNHSFPLTEQQIAERKTRPLLKGIIMAKITKEQQVVAVHHSMVGQEFVESPRAKDRQVGGDHYKVMGVEPWDVVDTWPREQRIGYYRGNALKYLMRMGSKDAAPMEVAKGQHYIQKLLEVLNEQE